MNLHIHNQYLSKKQCVDYTRHFHFHIGGIKNEKENSNGHLVSMYVLFLFTFERCAYYTAKWLMAIFVVATAAEGGLGLTKNDGAMMSSFIVAFTYITPVIGGFIADRWVSPRILVPIGEVLMGVGYLFAWKATGASSLYIMIVLVSLGTGFFKGIVSGINGRQFPKADEDMLNSSILYSVFFR